MGETMLGDLTTLSGRYTVQELIGRGGMAEVYLGRDTRLDRKVAIKLLRPELAEDPRFTAMFRQEAHAAARMSHPSVVRVYDAGSETTTIAGEERSVPFIVMEYVDGRLLRDIVAEEGALPEKEAVRIVSGILTALEYSHRAGVTHLDIKPGNVMLTPGGHVKVMDFGVARAISHSTASATETGTIFGTAQYFSPEQAKGGEIDGRTDLYSTGVVLFELLTGKPPFRADTAVAVAYQHISEQPPRPSDIVPGISPAMESVVAKALAKRPELRFQSAGEFQDALQAALRGVAVTDQPEENDEDALFLADHEATAATAVLGTQDTGDVTEDVVEVDRSERRRRNGAAWMIGGLLTAVVLLFVLVFSLGGLSSSLNFAGNSITVPELEGKSSLEATEELDALNLRVEIEERYDDSEPGVVLSQLPAAGTRVGEETPIRLVVSLGRKPTPLPDMSGLTVDQARQILDQNQLVFEGSEERDSATVAPGIVMESTPQAGQELRANTKVTLIVSSGKVQVPNVVDTAYGDATRLLETDIGYTVKQEADLSCWGGLVTGQSIPPGRQDQRQTITITYCGGNRPQQRPDPAPSASSDPKPTETQESDKDDKEDKDDKKDDR